ncbi:HAMP domain-containing histidine kinase [Nocardioides sp. GY 10127]|nr:HAMP domain-containing histidine kinase [Nocardioides sp. GY 10127]
MVRTTAAAAALAMLLLLLVLYGVLEQVVDHRMRGALSDRLDEAVSVWTSTDAGTQSDDDPLDELDGPVVLLDADGVVQAGHLPASLRDPVDRLLARGVLPQGEIAEDWQVRARQVDLPSADGGTLTDAVLVAAEATGPYESAEHLALIATAVLAVLTVGGVAATAAWTVGRALAPVTVMAAAADGWSETDLSRRFGLGTPRDELTALGATLDRLLGRVERALHAERRLTAEVAHELRTPLTAVLATADLMLLRTDLDDDVREAFEEIHDGARRTADAVTSLVSLARSGGVQGRCSVADLLTALDLTGVDVAVDDGLPDLDVPVDLAVRAVSPLLDNARRHAPGAVRLGVGLRAPEATTGTTAGTGTGALVALLVEDDGPGVAPGSDPFAEGGLGLPLARRVARTGGGDVVLLAPDEARDEPRDEPRGEGGRGARFEVTLPAVD